MYEIKVDASELRQYGELLRLAGPPMRRDLETDVMETSAYAQGIARGAAPIFRGSLVNSIQVDPLLTMDRGGALTISGGISSSRPHAVVMDEGRRPGARMPPLGPIVRWVELKVQRGDMQFPTDMGDGMTDQLRADSSPRRRRRRRRDSSGDGMTDQLRSDARPGQRSTRESRIRGLAFVIARSIARKGIKGLHFMLKAQEAATPHLAARINITIDRWVKRAGG